MIQLIYIDLFCGGGGTTTGVHNARIDGESCAIVAACINHDENAIRSHKSNHKQTLHFTEDITMLYKTSRMNRLVSHVQHLKSIYPNAKVVLWASLECTNFSKAKGGQSRDADSRTLADHLFFYIDDLKPDVIQIENVEEFMSWGPLDENGKPVSKTAGSDYMRWINSVKSNGYHFQHRILNAADFGALTSRKRFFGQFARLNEPIYWPEQTHAEKPESNLFGNTLKKWRAVKEVLDFTDEGESIFDRKKDLVEATLERICAGLVKFIAGGKREFLIKYNSMSQQKKYVAPDMDKPCPVVSTQGRLGLGSVRFLSKAYSGDPMSKAVSVERPSGAITCKDHHQLVNAYFMQQRNTGRPSSKVYSVDRPSRVVTTTGGNQELVKTEFIASYYGSGDNVSSVERPAPTLRTKDSAALIQTRFLDQQFGQSKPSDIEKPCGALTANPKYNLTTVKPFIMNQYSGGGQSSDINRPCPAIATVPKQNLMTVKPFIMNTNFNNIGSSIDQPAQTITANRKWHYLLNPQFQSAGGSIQKPCFTLIARMDKMPPYLVDAVTEARNWPSFIKKVGNSIVYEIYDTDSEIMVKIKEFMALYEIIDIKMRMLRILELLKIMGFPENYILIGTQADQKKFIGNAVEVCMATAIVEATAKGLLQEKLAA